MSSSHSSSEGILSRTQKWSDICSIQLPITKLNQPSLIAVESGISISNILYINEFYHWLYCNRWGYACQKNITDSVPADFLIVSIYQSSLTFG
jgi:hypothetical protein